jgi:DNA polymerase III subunit epsilon
MTANASANRRADQHADPELAIFLDTETTGLPIWGKPSEDPDQPHIVELAAVMVHRPTGRTVRTIHMVVKPEGWSIPEETIQIHGITTTLAETVGMSELKVARALLSFARITFGDDQAPIPIHAYNRPFDHRLVRILLKRTLIEDQALYLDAWQDHPGQCVMQMTSRTLKLPPTEKQIKAGFKAKQPKLSEAYEHFCGRPLEGAHGALADALACRDVFLAITGQPAEAIS